MTCMTSGMGGCGDPTLPAEVSVEFLRNLPLETGSLVVGISLGGLVAAKLQEGSRPDLDTGRCKTGLFRDTRRAVSSPFFRT